MNPDTTPALPREVWELDSETGARLLYAAGTPEAEAWIAANSAERDLEPLCRRSEQQASWCAVHDGLFPAAAIRCNATLTTTQEKP